MQIMNFGEKSRINSKQRMIEFLNTKHTGHFTTIDENGFPFTAPMNFVWWEDSVYIHGFPKGEKYDNIKTNEKCGFEASQELAFLPSYFFEPKTNASLTDTLYVSVVIKGTASMVTDHIKKATILNSLMRKYQKEGGYDLLKPEMATVRGVGMIRITPDTMTGRYKMGKYWNEKDKLRIAQRIMQRAIDNPRLTLSTLNISGLDKLNDEMTREVAWKYSIGITSLMGYENNSSYPEILLVSQNDVDW